MALLAFIVGLFLIGMVLQDTFEAIVMPRTVTRKFRFTRFFYLSTRHVWHKIARRISRADKRDSFLSMYGPSSILLLLGIWAIILMFAFAMVQWGLGEPFHGSSPPVSFGTQVYLSGVTFFTLGFGDITPKTAIGRFVSVSEAGMGFGFLAVVIGYLPVMYQSFSRREAGILLLDARAGSPPSAAELLARHGEAKCMEELTDLLREWERWSAELLESHLSYPVLAFYRSQHDRQSWIGALTTMLDTCALIRIGFNAKEEWQVRLAWQAQMTFAMARHAAVDLALVLGADPIQPPEDRLPPEQLAKLCQRLEVAGLSLCDGEACGPHLALIRRSYEGYVNSLAQSLMLSLPPYLIEEEGADNWQRSYWESIRHL